MRSRHFPDASNGRGRAGQPAAVGYLRRSTDRQEQSIPDQRQALEAYAADHGLRLSRLYVDDAISGTSTARRKAFQELIADAQKPDCSFQYVVVYDVKRFGRLDNDEAGYYRHILRTHGVEVLYVSENFSGDGTDDLLRPVKQWQAREESKDLSKVTIRGLLSRVKEGWWMGGTPPYGYDLRYENDRGEFLFALRFRQDGGKEMRDEAGEVVRTLDRGERVSITKRDRAKLIPGAAERVAVIGRIFQMATEEHRGYASIAEQLNASNVQTPRGPAWSHIYSGKWVSSSVREILLNPAYVGDMVWNRRTDGRFNRISNGQATERRDVYGARLVPNPEADWIVLPNSHTPLVRRHVWESARQIRAARVAAQTGTKETPRVSEWTGKRGRYLLSGLVRCAHCGGRYEGCVRSKGTPRRDGTRVRTHYYGCGTYIRRGRSACQFGPIPQEAFEAAVVDACVQFYADAFGGTDGRKRLRHELRALRVAEHSDTAQARLRAEADLKAIREKVARLLDNLTAANREHVDAALSQLDRERRGLERRLAALDDLDSSHSQVSDALANIEAYCETLAHTLTRGSPSQSAQALRRCTREIQVDALSGSAVLRLQRLPDSQFLADPSNITTVNVYFLASRGGSLTAES